MRGDTTRSAPRQGGKGIENGAQAKVSPTRRPRIPALPTHTRAQTLSYRRQRNHTHPPITRRAPDRVLSTRGRGKAHPHARTPSVPSNFSCTPAPSRFFLGKESGRHGRSEVRAVQSSPPSNPPACPLWQSGARRLLVQPGREREREYQSVAVLFGRGMFRVDEGFCRTSRGSVRGLAVERALSRFVRTEPSRRARLLRVHSRRKKPQRQLLAPAGPMVAAAL